MSWMLGLVSIMLYGIFLVIQTKSHSHFFVDADHLDDEHHHHASSHSNLYHGVLLLICLVTVMLLAKTLAMPINYSITTLARRRAWGASL